MEPKIITVLKYMAEGGPLECINRNQKVSYLLMNGILCEARMRENKQVVIERAKIDFNLFADTCNLLSDDAIKDIEIKIIQLANT